MKDANGRYFEVGDIVVKAIKDGNQPKVVVRKVEKIDEQGNVYLNGSNGKPIRVSSNHMIISNINWNKWWKEHARKPKFSF